MRRLRALLGDHIQNAPIVQSKRCARYRRIPRCVACNKTATTATDVDSVNAFCKLTSGTIAINDDVLSKKMSVSPIFSLVDLLGNADHRGGSLTGRFITAVDHIDGDSSIIRSTFLGAELNRVIVNVTTVKKRGGRFKTYS